MVEKLTWKKLAWESFFYAPWVLVGWIFGYLPGLLLAATVLQLGWHLHNQMRLSAWLWKVTASNTHFRLRKLGISS